MKSYPHICILTLTLNIRGNSYKHKPRSANLQILQYTIQDNFSGAIPIPSPIFRSTLNLIMHMQIKLYPVLMRDDYKQCFEASKFWIPRPKFTSLEIIINLCNDNTLGHRYLWLVDQQPGHMSSFDNKVRFRRRMLRYDLEKAMLVFIDVFEQFKNNVQSYDITWIPINELTSSWATKLFWQWSIHRRSCKLQCTGMNARIIIMVSVIAKCN